jgi:predicted helicase
MMKRATSGVPATYTRLLADVPLNQEEWTVKALEAFLQSCGEAIEAGVDIDALFSILGTCIIQQNNPSTKHRRGVVFTPPPVVDFMVKGVDQILKNAFGLSSGIDSQGVSYLDPASGTMEFACGLMLRAAEKVPDFDRWYHDVFLPKLHTTEILPSMHLLGLAHAAAVARDLGASLDLRTDLPRARLINAFTECDGDDTGEIFDEDDILVVIGNPPYNVAGKDDSAGINALVDEYFAEKVLQRPGMKRITGLKSSHDDYIRFIRFAQYKVEQRYQGGIIAFITNNSFLDGITKRGMRQVLKTAFDEIWIVDLHGEQGRERLPRRVLDAGIDVDENVFDITVSVCISFMVRYPADRHASGPCKVNYVEKWGLRQEKLAFLEMGLENLPFVQVGETLDNEFAGSHALDQAQLAYLKEFVYLPDIFSKHIQGIVTGADYFVSDVDREALTSRVEAFYAGTLEQASASVDFERARERNSLDAALGSIIPWTWRGFDKRYIVYRHGFMARDRYEVMQYLLPGQDNVSLVVHRQVFDEKPYSNTFITDTVFDNKCLEGSRGLHAYAFPMKVNLSEAAIDYDAPLPAADSNINLKVRQVLQLRNEITDEDIFYYIYGITWSQTFREKYARFLQDDFPRIPFTSDLETFIQMACLGKVLAEIHLLHEPAAHEPGEWPMSAIVDRRVLEPVYDEREQRIYFDNIHKKDIDKESTFWIGNVSPGTWAFELGNIQQLRNWLRERRFSQTPREKRLTRGLHEQEIVEFTKIVHAIELTLDIQKNIDKVYENVEISLDTNIRREM